MATDEYSKPGFVRFNDAVLMEAMTARLQIASNDKAVRTLLKGLAGFSNGPEEGTIECSNAIPADGFETNVHDLCRTHTTITMEFVISNISVMLRGRVMSVDTETSVDNPNACNFTFNGKIVNVTRASQAA